MVKKKLDYKLINIAIIFFIFFLIYQSSKFWLMILTKIITIITPFIIAFAIAHALYPLLKWIKKKGIPKVISIAIIVLIFLGFIVLIISQVIPIIFEQAIGLSSSITKFIHNISSQYDINLGTLQSTLADSLNNIIKKLGEYVSNGAFAIINKSISFISNFIIIIFVSIYLLIDMDKIRSFIKNYLLATNKKKFKYIKLLDYEISQYFNGLSKVIIWQLFEYTIIYYLIGHPHFLLLGILAAITTIVPYLGAMITNIIALITAFVISSELFIFTIITIVILSAIDSYIVAPKIYSGTNKIHPLLIIFAVFTGGIIAKIPGIILALPLTIILLNTFKFYRHDIYAKLKNKTK